MNNRNWQFFQEISGQARQNFPQYTEVVLQLLHNRGFDDQKSIDDFLAPDLAKDTLDPFAFDHMAEAVDLIISHIKAQNRIFIFGDYDADGVTSTALLFEVLSTLKAKVDIYIPHRVLEGYGMNKKAVEFISSQNAKLIITVDGGIRNKAEVALAKERGMDVVVTDHHIPPDEKKDYPDCLIINPVIADESYAFKHLVGVGVAFKLACALIRKSKLEESEKEKFEKNLLDLVAIGTVADCARLSGENRVLTKFGLEVLSKTKRIGLKELIKISSLKNQDKLDSWNIGFQIGPRLNAAGRLDHANTAYQLLVSKKEGEARDLAQKLNQRNQLRQQHTAELFEEVDRQIKNQAGNKMLIGICPENATDNPDDWNEGVIGLVAGRLTQKYRLPSLVFTKTNNGFKASGRSPENFNLIEAIEANSALLQKYGGHPAACGISVSEDNLSAFNLKIVDYVNGKMGSRPADDSLKIEAAVDFVELSEDLIEEIQKFAPFGAGNPKPVLASFGLKIMDIQLMGQESQHVKFRLKADDSMVFTALAFSEAEKWQAVKIGDLVDIAFYLELNEFNGRREVQLKVVDIKMHNA